MILTWIKKTVLLMIFSFLLLFASSLFADTRPSHQYKVIIIGAGSAGLAAAQDLYQHGIKDVLIIEARNRIGGRVWTIHPWGAATDLGASWIHRTNNNPIAELAKKHGVETLPTIYSLGNPLNKFSSFDLYDNNGKKISSEEMKSTLKLISKFNADTSQNKLHLKENASFEDAVNIFTQQEHLQGKNLQLFNFIAKDMIESDAGGDMKQISYSTGNSLHSIMSGNDVLPQGGYIRLFSEFAKNMSISLNNPVTAIHYDSQGVTIVTKKGVYHSRYVVVTLPLGVLQAGTVKFLPELPKEKLAAIKHLRMGFFNKIYLFFDKPFWNLDIEWISMMPNQNNPKPHYEALNLYKFVRQPILLFFSAGSFSEETEGWSDKRILDDVMHHLKLIYGDNISTPSAYLITRWGKDPFAHGSYSYPGIGSSIKDYKNLAAPVANKLFFAGEATSSTDPGTVTGAYLSGLSAAELIIQQLYV
ncbi:MAG: FAD-dependent oxidoreductase [Gammaproteobacteria bacterium]|nr:FAD-dependent oxidoreductase [Gammaproteobacteria bacterium]